MAFLKASGEVGLMTRVGSLAVMVGPLMDMSVLFLDGRAKNRRYGW